MEKVAVVLYSINLESMLLIIVIVIFLAIILYFWINNPSKKSPPPKETGSEDDKPRKSFREGIALAIIVLSAVILILLIILGCLNAVGNFNNIKEMFGILLPLIGTWVGTVLAYYFSKDNFEAANQSVKNLVNQVISGPEEKLRELKVIDVMLKPENFTYKSVDDEASFKACKIQELIDLMKNSNSERLPILKKDTLNFIFLIYRTTLERYQIFTNEDKTKPMNMDLTIQHMFESSFQLAKEIIALTEKQSFLPMSATLAEARLMMLDNLICKDVFITKTGKKDEKVEGWITDNIVIEKTEIFKKAGTKF